MPRESLPDECSNSLSNRETGTPYRHPTREEIAAAVNQTIPDVLADDLAVLFVGINPSLYSAAVGHHFARPGNRFWPALAAGGFTDRIYAPWEDQQLAAVGCGITNLVDRATARADQLSDDELLAGAENLQGKIERHRPRCTAFLGITAYRAAFGDKQAVIGRQERTIAGSQLWVLPNPSGLNAHYQLPDFARLFATLRTAYPPA
jgi:double-stranded uracil-DNA glycosylase